MGNMPLLEAETERSAKTKMGTRLDSGNGATTEVQEPRRVKAGRVSKQRIPRWGIFLFVVLAAFAVARTLQRGVATAKSTQPPARPVLVAKVISKDVPIYLDEIGTCAAYETVQVQAQVSGKILARHFQDGADLKTGDLLFTIDPAPYQAAFDQAKAQAVLDQITLKRQQELRARNVISPQDLDTAQANTHKSEAAAEAAQVNLDYCYIKSPINGRIGLRNVDIGNLVGPSTGSLVTIQGLDPIYTDFTVAETDLALVRKYLGGPNVKVQTYSPDEKNPPRLGDLYFIDTAVQPGSGTVKARGVTPNSDHAFWPSEFVRVRFILDTIKQARLVPSQAVQISQRGPFVFVLKPDNTVDLRPVKQGQRQDGDLIVIENGVQPDETVVVTGQLALAPGAKVDPKPYAPSASAENDGAPKSTL